MTLAVLLDYLPRRLAAELTVGVLAVADNLNIDEMIRVINGVDNSVVTYAKAPQVLDSAQLPHTRWPWISTELLNCRKDPPGS
jgi:hypothetical protein